MPKSRRILSAVLAVWLCVMLVAFTYTWVSRNWTPSIKSDEINIASSGALVISILSDASAVHTEVSLNDVAGLAVDSNFVFRQVSSHDGINFFWKDFSPTITGEDPAVFYKIKDNDTRRDDFIDTRFCLKLDDSLTTAKYIFIHPETVIEYVKENANLPDLNRAIRISLTYDEDIVTDSGTQTVSNTIILADLEDNTGVINDIEDATGNDSYRAVMNTADGKTELATDALGYQTVYGLGYFNCGREYYDETSPFAEHNYTFTRDESRALFKLNPGEQKWLNLRIWLEGQDDNCIEGIAGEKFKMVLKFDSAFVE